MFRCNTLKVEWRCYRCLTKYHKGSGDRAPCILNLGTRRRGVVSLNPSGFTSEERAPGPTDRRLGEPQSRARRCGKKRKTMPRRKSNPGRAACTLVLYWLQTFCCVFKMRNQFYSKVIKASSSRKQKNMTWSIIQSFALKDFHLSVVNRHTYLILHVCLGLILTESWVV
jgi:hypothetical protein